MNKSLFFSSVLSLSLITINADAQKISGNGQTVSRERQVGSFDEIQSSGSFDIVVTDGSNHQVRVEAEENLQEYIIVETSGDKLNVRHKKGVNFRATKPVIIHITAPALEAIRLSGSGNVKSTNTLNGSESFELRSSGSGNMTVNVETSDMKAAISGSGNITLKGKTRELAGSIAGSGNIRARDLQSEVTSVKISGSGSAEVVATQKLDSKIAGSGDVKYWGNASVNTSIAGSGSVRKGD